jgi:hypothetical protein
MITHQCLNFATKLLNLLPRAGLRHPLVYLVGEPIERVANVRHFRKSTFKDGYNQLRYLPHDWVEFLECR